MDEVSRQSLIDMCHNSDPIFILDGFNYVFKYYYAHKDLSVEIEDKTFYTGHMYGFLRNLLFLKEKFPNCTIVVCEDGYDASRRELYPEYKANRSEHDFDPKSDFNVIRRFSSLVDGVYWSYHSDFEADDIAASITRRLKFLCDSTKTPKQIYLLTSDRDWWQLVTSDDAPYTKIAVIKKWGLGKSWFDDAQIVREADVLNEFNGTHPQNLLKFRAITGDSSDNIKGYYRFFKKNAAIIAENFSYNPDTQCLSLNEGVQMRASWNKFLSTVTDNMDVFSRNYELMTLKDVDVSVVPIFTQHSFEDVFDIVRGLLLLQLNEFVRNVPNYSPYPDLIETSVQYLNSPAESHTESPQPSTGEVSLDDVFNDPSLSDSFLDGALDDLIGASISEDPKLTE